MKKNLNIIILGLAALSLSSCKTLYGKYERPDVKTSGIVRDVASDTDTLAVKDTTTFANIPWRSVFTDPQLQSIIEKGLNNNVNLLNAALNVKMAEEQLKCAKLAFVPSLAFTPQGTIASWDGQAATKTYTMPVTASWMVDLFGNLLSQKRGAQMALLQLQDYQVSVKTNLIANIANIGLNSLFIYGNWGCPEMGAQGAGLGTLLSRVLAAVLIIAYFCSRPQYRHYLDGFSLRVLSRRTIGRLVHMGLPISLQMFLESSAFVGTGIMMGWFGATAKIRSEERRVGKECRSRWSPYH